MIERTKSEFGKKRLRAHFEKLMEKEDIWVEVTQKRNTRSNRQNAWFHAVVGEFSDFTGYEKHEAKRYLKIVGGLGYEKDGVTHVKETHTLDTKSFAEFMETLIRWFDCNMRDFVIQDPERY